MDAVIWQALHYPSGVTANVRDLWRRKDLAPAKGHSAAVVAGHAVVMLTMRP